MPSDVLNLPQMPAGVRLHDYLGPWLIEPSRAAAIWNHAKSIDIAQHIANSPKRNPVTGELMSYMQRVDAGGMSVATIHVCGTMMKSESSLDESCSTLILRQDVRAAMRDESIDAVAMVFDSPGGSASGTDDLADDVRRLAMTKPTVAIVEDMCASAAYYVASQCNRIVATNSTALIGSIGTIIGMYDYSKWCEQEGLEALVFVTGDLKGAGFPGADVTDEQKAYFQRIVDENQIAFDNAVMVGRGLTAEELGSVKTGEVFSADRALKLGLIDSIDRFDAAMMSIVETVTDGRETSRGANMSATLAELKGSCIGADSQFLMEQIEVEATVEQAQSAWINTLQARLQNRDEQIAKMGEDHKAAIEQLNAEHAEKVGELEQQITNIKAGVGEGETPSHDGGDGAGTKKKTLADVVRIGTNN